MATKSALKKSKPAPATYNDGGEKWARLTGTKQEYRSDYAQFNSLRDEKPKDRKGKEKRRRRRSPSSSYSKDRRRRSRSRGSRRSSSRSLSRSRRDEDEEDEEIVNRFKQLGSRFKKFKNQVASALDYREDIYQADIEALENRLGEMELEAAEMRSRLAAGGGGPAYDARARVPPIIIQTDSPRRHGHHHHHGEQIVVVPTTSPRGHRTRHRVPVLEHRPGSARVSGLTPRSGRSSVLVSPRGRGADRVDYDVPLSARGRLEGEGRKKSKKRKGATAADLDNMNYDELFRQSMRNADQLQQRLQMLQERFDRVDGMIGQTKQEARGRR